MLRGSPDRRYDGVPLRRAAILPLLLVLACDREPVRAPAASAVAPSGPAGPGTAPREPPHPLHAPAPDWGEPDRAKVETLFRSRFAEVKRCYEAELQRHPDARGRLTLRFEIVESGALRHVSVAKTSFERRDVPDCVVGVVRRWKTPFHPREPVEVEYPFSFSPRVDAGD